MPKKISKQSKREVKKNGVTIDDLALMVRRGFDGQNQRFDVIEKRLFNVETTVSILREDFNKMQETINNVYNRLDRLISMFEKTEQENVIIKARLLKIEKVLKERFQIDINAIN